MAVQNGLSTLEFSSVELDSVQNDDIWFSEGIEYSAPMVYIHFHVLLKAIF